MCARLYTPRMYLKALAATLRISALSGGSDPRRLEGSRMAREEREADPRRAVSADRAAEPGVESGGHPQERGAADRDVREARVCGDAVRDQGQPGGVCPQDGGGREGHADVLHPLRRPGQRPEGMDARRAVSRRRPTAATRASICRRSAARSIRSCASTGVRHPTTRARSSRSSRRSTASRRPTRPCRGTSTSCSTAKRKAARRTSRRR